MIMKTVRSNERHRKHENEKKKRNKKKIPTEMRVAFLLKT